MNFSAQRPISAAPASAAPTRAAAAYAAHELGGVETYNSNDGNRSSSFAPTRTFDFATQREAINSFITRCDELGYDYYETSTGMEAGGIGHDLLITVTFNK